MTIINNSRGALQNSAKKFELSISDTNTHDLPDTDGDDASDGVGGTGFDARTAQYVAAYVQNNQDAELTATLKRTPDLKSDIEVEDVEPVTVAPGDSTVLVAFENAPHGIYRVIVEFTSAPTGTNKTVVEYDVEVQR